MKLNLKSLRILLISLLTLQLIGCKDGIPIVGTPTPNTDMQNILAALTVIGADSNRRGATYKVSGTVSGHTSDVTIRLENSKDLAPTTNEYLTLTPTDTTFTFNTGVLDRSQITIYIQANPTNQSCMVLNSFAKINNADHDTVEVNCSDNLTGGPDYYFQNSFTKPLYSFDGFNGTHNGSTSWEQVLFYVGNKGDATPGPTETALVTIYFSELGTLSDPDKIKLDHPSYPDTINPILPGGIDDAVGVAFDETVAWPGGNKLYTGFLIAVLDEAGNVAEVDENNNVLSIPVQINYNPLPDLQVTSVTVNPASIPMTVGTPGLVDIVITNAGALPVNTAFDVNFYLPYQDSLAVNGICNNLKDEVAAGSITVDAATTPIPEKGGTLTLTDVSIDLPNTTYPWVDPDYVANVCAWVDGNTAIPESFEENNRTPSAPFQINVAPNHDIYHILAMDNGDTCAAGDDTLIQLYDEFGILLAENDDDIPFYSEFGSIFYSHLNLALLPGTYYLRVSAKSATAYTLFWVKSVDYDTLDLRKKTGPKYSYGNCSDDEGAGQTMADALDLPWGLGGSGPEFVDIPGTYYSTGYRGLKISPENDVDWFRVVLPVP